MRKATKRLCNFVLCFILGSIVATGWYARDFYVKPDGDDNADGTSVATAWRTIERGDVLVVMQPGDTVHVMAGDYAYADANPNAGYDFRVNVCRRAGTPGHPITYRAEGEVTVSASGTGDLNAKKCLLRPTPKS